MTYLFASSARAVLSSCTATFFERRIALKDEALGFSDGFGGWGGHGKAQDGDDEDSDLHVDRLEELEGLWWSRRYLLL